MTQRDALQGQIDKYLQSITHNAPELAPLANDAVYGGPMVPETLRGATAIRQFLGEIAPFIDRVEQLQSVIEGDSAAVIIEIRGLRKRKVLGSMFFEFDKGLITAVQVFFDSRLLIRDLG